MEAKLGAPLPAGYRDLLTHEGVLCLTTPNPGDAECTSPVAAEHVVEASPKTVGVDYWFSFHWPAQAVRTTEELITRIEEDFEDAATDRALQRAVVFQQGYGDAAFYLFLADAAGSVTVCYLDGSEGSAAPVETSRSFEDHLVEYVQRWRRIRRF
jgi:hypothetical protein